MNSNGEPVDSGGAGGYKDGGGEANDHAKLWTSARIKADVFWHPLYDQLLSAHLECLRIVTAKYQHSRIDAQLAQSQHVVTKYSMLGNDNILIGDRKELVQFMVFVKYVNKDYVALLAGRASRTNNQDAIGVAIVGMLAYRKERPNIPPSTPSQGASTRVSGKEAIRCSIYKNKGNLLEAGFKQKVS